MINPDRLSLLTAALRSDRFQQGHGHLTINPGLPTEKNCCLGVACIVAMENGLQLDYVDLDTRMYLDDEGHTCGTDGDDLTICGCYTNDTVLPRAVVDWYGFPDEDPDMIAPMRDGDGGTYEARHSASSYNDDLGFDFAGIADAFDSNFTNTAEMEDPSGRLEP